MKFLLLCKRFYTNKDLITDHFGRLYHLPAELGKLGNQGMVIAGDYRSTQQETFSAPGINFLSYPLSLTKIPEYTSRVNRIIKKTKPDIIIASSDTLYGLLGLSLAHKHNIPFVFDIYDNYGAFKSATIPGMERLFYYTAKHANLLITASTGIKQQFSSISTPSIVIENGTDQQLFKPLDKKQCRKELSLAETETIIGFFGSIEKNRGIDVLIDSVTTLRIDSPHTRLLIAGHNGTNLDLNIPGVDYRGNLPQGDIPKLINACDIVAIPYLPDKQVDISNACKISEYVACNVPVVATKVSDHSTIFSSVPQSLCEPDDAQDMLRAIREQLHAPQVLSFPSKWSWRDLAVHLDKSFNTLLNQKRAEHKIT